MTLSLPKFQAAPLYVICSCAVSAAEDPERILDQAVEDMNNDLIKLRQATAKVCLRPLQHCHARSLDTKAGFMRCFALCSAPPRRALTRHSAAWRADHGSVVLRWFGMRC